MMVHYTGRQVDISDQDKDKASKKFEKIQRILGANQSLDAHVVLSKQRHMCEAEVTLHALHHTLVVTGSNADAFAALSQALTKLEKQATRNKHKLVDGKRVERQRGEPAPVVAAALNGAADHEPPVEGEQDGLAVIRSVAVEPKPISLEEARMHLEDRDRDQITYRDLESGRLCVLLRRRDGGLELVETSA
ncbi:MAG: ribosome-associated translation inhibitor RaiA [Bryobacterales bacterium]